MRHILLTLAMLLAPAAWAQNTFIDLDVSGVPDGTVFKLQVASTHRQEKPIQSTALSQGKAYFAFDSEEPRLYELMCDEPWGRIEVMATKGDRVKINAVGALNDRGRGPFYEFNPVQVKGSLLHNEYQQKLQIREDLNQLYTRYHEENKEVVQKMAGLKRGSDEWNAMTQTPEFQKYADAERNFFQTVEERYNQLFLQNRDSWWGPFLVLNTMNYVPEGTKALYDQFSDEAKNSFYGQALAEQVMPKSVIGKKVEDFQFTDHATGKATSLYAELKGKRYLLLDFWASWCGPCRREIPNFKAQYDLYKDRGFGIVSISADANEADWLKALDEEQLPWPNGLDTDKSICRLYDVQYYPTVYVVDSEGRVVAKDKDARGENLRTLLAELFK